MNKKIFLFLFTFILVPQHGFASQLEFQVVPNTDPRDNATIVGVYLDSNDKNINVVDGSISIKANDVGKLYVNPDTTDSVLTLWPTPPQFIDSEGILRFVGGVPNGFKGKVLILKMRLSSRVAGVANISWSDGSGYVNDGKGTLENISAESLSVNIKSTGDNSTKFYTQKWFIGAIIFLIFVFVLFVIYGKKKNI